MKFLELLRNYQIERRSIRRLLSGFGVTKWSTFAEPLRNLSEEEVIALLLNWITRNLTVGKSMTLRIRDNTSQDVYEVWLTSDKGCLYVKRLLKRAQLNEQRLYYWPQVMTPNDLTLETIEKSMEMAGCMNA